MKKFILIVAVLLAGVGIYFWMHQGASNEYREDNSILGIRGFRHEQLFASGGSTERYEVGVGEEFKVLALVHVLSNDGEMKWHGPAGIGEGSVVLKASASADAANKPVEEKTELKVFTATQSGTAEFTLITTNPGQSDPEENKIIVTIK